MVTLLDFGISKIPKSQAQRLPNKTLPIPGDEGNYIRCPVRISSATLPGTTNSSLSFDASLNLFTFRI